MIDTNKCPICSEKLKNRKLKNHYLYFVENISDYIEKTCSNGMNHTVQIFTDVKTKKIHLLKTSLSHDYSKFIEFDFLNSKSRISYFKLGIPEYINIKKLINPDFPKLINIKDKVNTYVNFI